MIKLILALLFVQAAPAPRQQPQSTQTQTAVAPGSVEGYVVEAATSKPVAKAQVSLVRTDVRGQGQAATTNSGGYFVFPSVTPGTYRLVATRNGYSTTEYGQRSLNRPGLTFTVSPGQAMQNAILYIIPAGTIAGRVFDMDGEALAGVNVQAFKYVYQNGERVLSPVQTARSNDLGEYRLYWLTAGQYYVSATYNAGLAGVLNAVGLGGGGRGGGGAGQQLRAVIQGVVGSIGGAAGQRGVAGVPIEDPDGDETYIPVYYPGTTEVERAAAIDLRPGTVYNGIDLTIAQARTLRVSGRVLGANGQPAPNAQVLLVPRQRNGAGLGLNNQFRGRGGNQGGTFEIRGVVPGSYDVIAMVNDRSTGPMSARTSVEVGSSDIENLTLAVTAGFTISGRVTLALDGADSSIDVTRLRVTLQSRTPGIPVLAGGGGGGGRGGQGGQGAQGAQGGQAGQPGQAPVNTPPGQIKSDRTFTLLNVGPGDYRVTVNGLPRTAYIRELRLGGTDVLTEGLRLDGPPPGVLDILISNSTGILDGSVLDGRQNPAANITAVLVPDTTRRQRSDLYRTVNTDASGKFHIEGIPPGDYKVFAWEDVEPGAWQDPNFMRNYEDQGRNVRIPEKGTAAVELKVIGSGN